MSFLDISIVTYRPRPEQLSRLAETLAENLATLGADAGNVTVRVFDNASAAQTREAIHDAFRQALPAPHCLVMNASGRNLGFGAAHNRNLADCGSDFLLVLNQDVEIEPGALAELLRQARRDSAGVAAWEMRQIPYEHPKAYDPATRETGWVSGAATLFRRTALDRAAGFDRRIFLYGEDVDLSWRLRAAGWRLRYMPRCAVVHHTYDEPAQVKPAQVMGSTLANLCLRARFGDRRDVLRGIAMLWQEIRGPQSFPGRRIGLALNLLRFARAYPYFRFSHVDPTADFAPLFAGWDYEVRREGAFFAFPSRRHWPPLPAPCVSIIVRAGSRQASLRKALASVAGQTYPRIEVVLATDAACECDDAVAEYRDVLSLRRVVAAEGSDRFAVFNAALSTATGEWIVLLDENALLFADHVEACLYSAMQDSHPGAYALAWAAEGHSAADARDRPPLQSVLFRRELYQQHGGFDHRLAAGAEADLWHRYELASNFCRVEKTTSICRPI